MGFPGDVKEKALVAAARRCCVCKEFKGINTEVHHIIPPSEGGADTFDNAIPLCFDCHANAGHYNPRHPRGTKFSPEELRKHRDTWYSIVENGRFLSNGTNITQQYFLCNSFDIVSELIDGKFDNFPFKNVKLVKNEHYSFLKSARHFNGDFSRESDLPGESYEGIEDYLSKHPSAKRIDSEWGTTHWRRDISIEELTAKLFHKDFVTNYLIRNGVSAHEIARASFSEHACADDSSSESLILRGAKTIFVGLINSGTEVVQCHALSEHFFSDNTFTSLGATSPATRQYQINGAPLLPGECLLIPCCTVLTPFDDDLLGEQRLIYQSLESGQSQDTRALEIKNLGDYPTIGPYHNIVSVHQSSGLGIVEEQVRSLSIKRVLIISRSWECGSCPHLLIFNHESNSWKWAGELFPHAPNHTHMVKLDLCVPMFDRATFLRIVEVENETTYISALHVDNDLIVRDCIIDTGQYITVDISGASRIHIEGYYRLYPNVAYKQSSSIKRKKILHFVFDMNREASNAFQPTCWPPIRSGKHEADLRVEAVEKGP